MLSIRDNQKIKELKNESQIRSIMLIALNFIKKSKLKEISIIKNNIFVLLFINMLLLNNTESYYNNINYYSFLMNYL